MTDFERFFTQATGLSGPYPYQRTLAEEAWPEVLDVPTGLGKTAAVTLAWLYRRRECGEHGMPRRLIWCLPMRVLVEQAQANITQWLDNLGIHGAAGETGRVAVHTLMGGDPDLQAAHWARHPEQEAILIGTQDMLLSRALMRGYGISRYQWPVHFALLHHDSLWVFDEVQLMGAALPTSTQLEAFRRASDAGRYSTPARSLWISATLRPDWLATVDFRPHVYAGLATATLSDADRAAPEVTRRLTAPKALAPAESRLSGSRKADIAGYIAELSDEVRRVHTEGTRTLIILNRVERAQALYRALAASDAERVLLHARFRPTERRAIEQYIKQEPAAPGQIVIATQAVEAGVDLSSRTLFTELAPWSSLVQRFGRCNRGGEHAEAVIRWMDLGGDDIDLLPYSRLDLDTARARLQALTSASPGELPGVDGDPERGRVLRRRDLRDLFNTDPDLSGFDVDVSPYIRDTGSPQLQAFWRAFEDRPSPEEPGPGREELCNVSVAQMRAHLQALKRPRAWVWDPLLQSTTDRSQVLRGGWRQLRDVNEVRPGQTVMLCADDGGYRPTEGFVAGARETVTAVHPGDGEAEANDTESTSVTRRWIPLREHLDDVTESARVLAQSLGVPDDDRELLETAARWHDAGKAHEAFQRGIGADPALGDGPWAKSDGSGCPAFHVLDESGEPQPRPGFRHELASTLAWLERADEALPVVWRDRIAYIIAAHHGRVRLGLRALPGEAEPAESGRLFARGIWHGDRLPPVQLNGQSIPATELRLDLMRLGVGAQGASWSERTHRLLEQDGPFRLAWPEALLRIADWRASAVEERNGGAP